MNPRRYQILAGCALAAATLAFVELSGLDPRGSEPSRPSSGQDDPVVEAVPASVARESSGRSRRTLQDHGEVSLDSMRTGSEHGESTMRPMEGTLDPAEKARLLSEFDAAVVSLATRKAEIGSSLDPSSEDDILTEAGMDRSLAL